MTAHPLTCWKCGASLEAVPLPLSRLSECPQCRAYLHSCRQCRFYDPRSPDRCREERAEHVRDCETANFCDWFAPHSPSVQATRSDAVRTGLDSLFGGSGAPVAPANPLDALFSDDKKKS